MVDLAEAGGFGLVNVQRCFFCVLCFVFRDVIEDGERMCVSGLEWDVPAEGQPSCQDIESDLGFWA